MFDLGGLRFGDEVTVSFDFDSPDVGLNYPKKVPIKAFSLRPMDGIGCDGSLPTKRIINDDACILFFDDKKYIVRRMKGDSPDPEKAFLWAYFLAKSGLSRTKVNKYLEEIRKECSKVKKIDIKKG